MLNDIRIWLASDSAERVGRTFLQVFGGLIIAALLDWGKDGVINLHSYIFGDTGVIVVGAMAIAGWMNRKIR